MGTVFIRHLKPRVYFSGNWQRWLIENTQRAPDYVVVAAQDLANHLNSLPRRTSAAPADAARERVLNEEVEGTK